MKLTKLKTSINQISKPDHVEALIRYVDTLGTHQTVEIADVIEEIPRSEEAAGRKLILVAGSPATGV